MHRIWVYTQKKNNKIMGKELRQTHGKKLVKNSSGELVTFWSTSMERKIDIQ